MEISDKLRHGHKICYITGDFNINIWNAETHSSTNDVPDNMYARLFYSLISKTTSLVKASAALKDNIFTNDCSYRL
jgi:hypothetical protein